MRAVWYDRQRAGDEVLGCGELPTPEVGHGEVRVRLEASGVNPSDTYRRRGPPAMEYPRVVTNSDGAGGVDQVGPGVSQHWLGKRVSLYNGQRNGRWMGTAAEYIALSADLVTELPDHVSFPEGATLAGRRLIPRTFLRWKPVTFCAVQIAAERPPASGDGPQCASAP